MIPRQIRARRLKNYFNRIVAAPQLPCGVHSRLQRHNNIQKTTSILTDAFLQAMSRRYQSCIFQRVFRLDQTIFHHIDSPVQKFRIIVANGNSHHIIFLRKAQNTIIILLCFIIFSSLYYINRLHFTPKKRHFAPNAFFAL